ncbi:HdeD family acid-resistance protein [Legionella israelensis]|uniref:HdeD family acid-resistance protein n=1 Tax=Legionella israelensis TaxID=454 RepID=A0AAX1EK46_9GAMM|nr:HdeD family acid-resistance protein [Legionella israelensis]QBR85212.1 HdeD family acid-resistance protein [Legionella israelensis]
MQNSANKNQFSANVGLIPHHWGWLLGLGILFVILGTIGLAMVIGLTIVSMIFFGVLLICAGVSQAVDAVKYKKWKGVFWQIIIALLYIAGGALVIYDPLLASTLITAFLAIVLIIIGVSRLLMAFLLKEVKGWGWMFLAGIAALILGILILMQWPLSGLWFIGLLIAIELIINGWAYILIALSLRKT